MLAGQRQKLILDEVRRLGAVRVSELTELLGVSDMTVRRDLDALAAQASSRRCTAARPPRAPQRGRARVRGEVAPAARRRRSRSRARGRAGRAGSGDRADGRDDDLAVGAPPPRRASLTVVTNSIPVANVLHAEPRPDLTVILTGGVRTPSDALVGPVAVPRFVRSTSTCSSWVSTG